MSSMKIRKKSRFNGGSSGGVGWGSAWKYGVAPKKRAKRSKIRREREAKRNIEAQRQAQDQNVSWDEVRVLLDEGMTLKEAKELCRME